MEGSSEPYLRAGGLGRSQWLGPAARVDLPEPLPAPKARSGSPHCIGVIRGVICMSWEGGMEGSSEPYLRAGRAR